MSAKKRYLNDKGSQGLLILDPMNCLPVHQSAPIIWLGAKNSDLRIWKLATTPSADVGATLGMWSNIVTVIGILIAPDTMCSLNLQK